MLLHDFLIFARPGSLLPAKARRRRRRKACATVVSEKLHCCSEDLSNATVALLGLREAGTPPSTGARACGIGEAPHGKQEIRLPVGRDAAGSGKGSGEALGRRLRKHQYIHQCKRVKPSQNTSSEQSC